MAEPNDNTRASGRAAVAASAVSRPFAATLRMFRRRFFLLTGAVLLLVIIAGYAAVHIFFTQERINGIASGVLDDVFDTSKVAVTFDKSATKFTFPQLNGTGRIELFGLTVRSVSGTYDVLHVPHLVVHYDLYGVPTNSIARRVVIPEGLYAVANFDASVNWLDAAAFRKSATPASGPPPIPEIIVRDAAVVVRFPAAFLDPPAALAAKQLFGREFHDGGGGYYLSHINASLLDASGGTGSGVKSLVASMHCDLTGDATIAGTIKPTDTGIDLDRLRVVKRGIPVNRALVSRLTPAATKIVDLLFADDGETPNNLDVSAELSLKRGVLTTAVRGQYTGCMMYCPVPLLLRDVSALIEFDGQDLRIVDASGRRDTAKVSVSGSIAEVGRRTERLDIRVKAVGLVITPDLLHALNGEPDGHGGLRYGEWEKYRRPGATLQPSPPPAIGLLYGQFEPSGLMSLNIHVRHDPGFERDELDFDVLIADASARYVGRPESLAAFAAISTQAPPPAATGALRAIPRLSGGQPAPEPQSREPVFGFPVPLYDVSGVVSGSSHRGEQPVFTVRGLNVEEAREIEQTLGVPAKASPRGLVANRVDSRQHFFINATLLESRDSESATDDSRLRLNISADGLRLDDELTALLPGAVKQRIREYGLQGLLDVSDAQIVVAGLKNGTPEITVAVEAKDMQARVQLPGAAEPLPIRDITGHFRFDQAAGGVILDGFEGRTFDKKVEFSVSLKQPVVGTGAVSPVPSRRAADEIRFSGKLDDLVVAASLFRFLPAEVKTAQDFFTSRYSGKIAVSVAGNLGQQKSPDSLVVDVQLEGGELSWPGMAPVTLRDVRANLRVQQRQDGIEIRILSLTGVPLATQDSTESGGRRAAADPLTRVNITGAVFVSASGGRLPVDASTRVELTVDATDVLLSRELKAGLNKLMGGTDEAPDNLIAIWNDLEPTTLVDGRSGSLPIGRINVAGRISLRLPPDDQNAQSASDNPATSAAPPERASPKRPTISDYAFQVALRHGAVTYSGFRLPLHDVSVDLLLRPGAVTFSGLKASAPAGRVEVPQFDWGGGALTLLISARDLPLDGALRAAMPPNFSRAYNALAPKGLSNIDLRMRFLDRADKRVEYDAAIQLLGVVATVGVNLDDCRGLLTVSGAVWDTPEGRQSSNQSQLQLDYASWKKVQFRSVTASGQFHGGRLTLPNIRGSVHAGTLTGSLDLDVRGDDPVYAGTLEATGVRLRSLATVIRGGEGEDPNEVLSGGVDVSIVYGTPGPDGILGRGRIDVGREPLTAEELADIQKVPEELRGGRTAKLGAVPMFGSLYKQLNLVSGEYFNEAHLVFHLRDDRTEIRQMNLISDAMRVETIQENYILYDVPPDGQQINMVLVPTLFPRTLPVPGLQTIFDAVKGVVFRIFVGGTLEKPVVSPLTKSLEAARKGEDAASKLPQPSRTRVGE
jgi:hypothetical protein